MADDRCTPGRYASPPCLASELDPSYFDPLAVDPQQAADVARWRKAQRKRLLDARRALSVEKRTAINARLIAALEPLLLEWIDGDVAPNSGRHEGCERVVSGYWPIKSEPDMRPMLRRLHADGLAIALPIVETKAAPLVFRRWTPETKMQKGDWNIPVPPPESEVLLPTIALAPLVGWDSQGFRLGYGGGYFDRTLAGLGKPDSGERPLTIGIGLEDAQLPSIYPQPHDVRLDAIVTEEGLRFLAFDKKI